MKKRCILKFSAIVLVSFWCMQHVGKDEYEAVVECYWEGENRYLHIALRCPNDI